MFIVTTLIEQMLDSIGTRVSEVSHGILTLSQFNPIFPITLCFCNVHISVIFSSKLRFVTWKSGNKANMCSTCVCVCMYVFMVRYDIFLTAIGLTPSSGSTVRIYTQTIHRTTQLTHWEECGPCPVFASYTLAFAL